jgi:peptidoglycan/LPS O-acetylase OafA/YrhL
MNKISKRYAEIDALKGLAIIGVVIAHMTFQNRFEDSTLELVNRLQGLFGWCVIAFFFCSGLLEKPLTAKDELIKSLIKRFKRLVVPSIVFSVSYKFILLGISLTKIFSWQSPIPTSIEEVVNFILFPVGPQFYFLYYLYVISSGVAVFTWLTSNTALFFSIAIALPTFYVFIDMPSKGYGSEYSLLPIYLFSYVLGCASSKKDKDIGATQYYCMVIMPVIITAILSKSLTVCYIFVPISMWIIFRNFPNLPNLINKTKLGKYSSAIYVWHAPLALPIASIVCVKLISGRPIVVLFTIFSTIASCYVLGKLTLRYRWLRIWRL